MKQHYTTEIFIEKAKQVHGDKYDYSKVVYINSLTKVCIICPKHGEFWQKPGKHLYGYGCAKCGYEKLHFLKKKSKDDFIKDAKKIWGDKYDYSKVEYVNNVKKVCIICPKHGEFWQTPANHLSGYEGCRECSGDFIFNTKNFITESSNKHHNFYDYSKSIFENNNTKITIICPIHGEFKQRAYNHAILGQGCPKCKSISILEKEVRYILDKNNIVYEEQKKFPWLGIQTLDFFIPQFNIAIECQGRQHFIDGCFNEPLNIIEKRDIKKYNLCLKNNINIFYVKNKNYKHMNTEIYSSENTFDIKIFGDIINQVIKKEIEK